VAAAIRDSHAQIARRTPARVPLVFIGKPIFLFQEREKAGSAMSPCAAVCSRSWLSQRPQVRDPR